jgi:hypothetical protein
MMPNFCPVCGFESAGDTRPPYSIVDGGSFDICPGCGFQYGVTDGIKHETFDSWREKWVRAGAQMHSEASTPQGWSAAKQLRNIGIDLTSYRLDKQIPTPEK